MAKVGEAPVGVGVQPQLMQGQGHGPVVAVVGAWLGQWGLLRQRAFLKIKSSCSSLLLLTSTWPVLQPNFPTRQETIWVRVCHGPTLFPCPDVTQLHNFSGTFPAGDHSPIGVKLPLCVSHCIFISPSNLEHPGLSWCRTVFPALLGELQSYNH